jgi:hypothetical protein
MDWDELNGKLRGIVLEAAHLLLQSEVQDIWEYIDYDEPGLAFETWCTQLHEHNSVVSAESVSRLAEIGSAMDLEPSPMADSPRRELTLENVQCPVSRGCSGQREVLCWCTKGAPQYALSLRVKGSPFAYEQRTPNARGYPALCRGGPRELSQRGKKSSLYANFSPCRWVAGSGRVPFHSAPLRAMPGTAQAPQGANDPRIGQTSRITPSSVGPLG